MREGRPWSTGGCYIAIENLHRAVRYLQHNVILAFNTTGPNEPSLEDLNHVAEPLVTEFQELYKGIHLSVSPFCKINYTSVNL